MLVFPKKNLKSDVTLISLRKVNLFFHWSKPITRQPTMSTACRNSLKYSSHPMKKFDFFLNNGKAMNDFKISYEIQTPILPGFVAEMYSNFT